MGLSESWLKYSEFRIFAEFYTRVTMMLTFVYRLPPQLHKYCFKKKKSITQRDRLLEAKQMSSIRNAQTWNVWCHQTAKSGQDSVPLSLSLSLRIKIVKIHKNMLGNSILLQNTTSLHFPHSQLKERVW